MGGDVLCLFRGRHQAADSMDGLGEGLLPGEAREDTEGMKEHLSGSHMDYTRSAADGNAEGGSSQREGAKGTCVRV